MIDCECGRRYADHRTGLTFAEVRRMMFVASDDPKLWRYKRRHGVLGFWRALKIQSYKYEHGYCGSIGPSPSIDQWNELF